MDSFFVQHCVKNVYGLCVSVGKLCVRLSTFYNSLHAQRVNSWITGMFSAQLLPLRAQVRPHSIFTNHPCKSASFSQYPHPLLLLERKKRKDK